MSKLKPCPFCGGAPKIVDDNGRHGMVFSVRHQCESTGGRFNRYGSVDRLTIDTGWYDSEQEAIDAWNTRAERTCKVVDYNRYMFSYSVYLSCGHEISEINYFPRYCPKCGAKVEVIQDANV